VDLCVYGVGIPKHTLHPFSQGALRLRNTVRGEYRKRFVKRAGVELQHHARYSLREHGFDVCGGDRCATAQKRFAALEVDSFDEHRKRMRRRRVFRQ
jgi:hypothetical protein